MGLLDSLLGRRKPVQPNLDALFALPVAGVGLEAEAGLRPTGSGSVCFRSAEGPGFAATLAEAKDLLGFGKQSVQETTDRFGYTWLTSTADPDDIEGLVTALHGANSSLQAAGFGPQLLCSVVTFTGDVDGEHRNIALVYLYKRGTFYPFAPTGPEKRDTALELRIKTALAKELPFEEDLSRWFPVWGAPGL